MPIEGWVALAVMVLALLGLIIVRVIERRDENALFDRLHSDPEFARQYHEQRKHDDWEDSGYFDGR